MKLSSFCLGLVLLDTGLPGLANADPGGQTNDSATGYVGTYFSYQPNLISVSGFTVTNLPSQFTFNSFTGSISGTPTTQGVYSLTISANEVYGIDNLTITIGPPLPTGYAGGTFVYLPSVAGAVSFSASNLPPWLTIDPTTGLLSGTAVAGSYSLGLTATEADNTQVASSLSINIGSAPDGSPEFTGVPASLNGYYQFTATNSPASYSAPYGLPATFTLTSSGLLSYTGSLPIGTYDISVLATNAAGSTLETLPVTIGTNSTAFAVMHNFQGAGTANDGVTPNSLFQAADGSLYGTTQSGGNSGDGTIFDTLSGSSNVIASLGGAYGNDPVGVIEGSDGNLYGVAAGGGSQNEGTIFRITPAGVMTVLHTFGDGSVANDGANPAGGLLQGPDGNFYGTTLLGGSANHGTIFSITPSGTLSIIHNFGDGSVASDGISPSGNLIFVPNGLYYLSGNTYYPDGAYYGTTRAGGGVGVGTVFSITTQHHLTILHQFDPLMNNDGDTPMAGLLYYNGSLYGTTYGTQGGIAGNGTVFSLSPSGANYNTIYTFGLTDGAKPLGDLLVYSIPGTLIAPTLIGTTSSGGASGSSGTIFQLAFGANGVTESVLYDFSSLPSGGAGIGQPESSLFEDVNGNIYGTTQSGGTSASGTVFALEFLNDSGSSNPASAPPIVVLPGTGSPPFNNLPSGMYCNPATGALYGTPIASQDPQGTYNFQYDYNNAPQTPTYTYLSTGTMTLGAYPTISTTLLPNGTVGSLYSQQLSASSSPTSYTVTGLPSTLTCSSSGLITGTPTTAGTYNLSVSATNSLGQGPSTAFVLTVTAPTQSFSGWQSLYFPTKLADSAVSGPTATPENDGVPNLLKYLCDINPTAPMSATDRAALPAFRVATNGDLTLTFRESSLETGITISAQTSADLQTWTTLSPSQTLSPTTYTIQPTGTTDPTTGDPYMQVEVQKNATTQQFVRLNVTSP